MDKGTRSLEQAPVAASREPDGTNLLDFVQPESLEEIRSHLLNPRVLFSIQFARQIVARDRARSMLAEGVTKAQTTDAVAFNALEYNLEGARTAPMEDRPTAMTNVVASISSVAKRIGELDVLSIGPRSEIELFGMIGAGFNASRIRGLDLFSYSPLIDAGDMHEMPYAGNSFDVVFASWVLQYSKDQKRAASEILRVARPKAIVSVAADHTDQKNDRFRGQNTHLRCSDEILALFEGHIDHIFFRHEPELPEINMTAAVFRLKP